MRLTILCLSGFELYSRWVPLNDDNDENDDDEIAFSLPDRKTGNPYAGEGHEDKPKINYI